MRFWYKKSFLSYILFPLSLIYNLASKINYKFQSPKKFNKKIICVGNVVAGGAGKTPIAKAIAKEFNKRKINVNFAVRNFSRKLDKPFIVKANSKYKDNIIEEAYELKAEGDVAVANSRLDAVENACGLKGDVVLVDDGLQNNKYSEIFMKFVIDGVQRIGNGLILPAGPMRESLISAVKKTDAVVAVNLKDKKFSKMLKGLVGEKNFFDAIAEIEIPKKVKDRPCIAFAGIAFPQKFFKSLREQGVELLDDIIFPDHHEYIEKDLTLIKLRAKELNATILTTEKDYIKLNNDQSIHAVKYNLKIVNSEKLMQLIDEKNTAYS